MVTKKKKRLIFFLVRHIFVRDKQNGIMEKQICGAGTHELRGYMETTTIIIIIEGINA